MTPQADFQPSALNDSYIIMLNHDLDSSIMDNHFNFVQSVHEINNFSDDSDSGVRQIYDGHVKGYAGRFTEETINKIREQPEVRFIEKDQVYTTR
jgi:cerevisin